MIKTMLKSGALASVLAAGTMLGAGSASAENQIAFIPKLRHYVADTCQPPCLSA